MLAYAIVNPRKMKFSLPSLIGYTETGECDAHVRGLHAAGFGLNIDLFSNPANAKRFLSVAILCPQSHLTIAESVLHLAI